MHGERGAREAPRPQSVDRREDDWAMGGYPTLLGQPMCRSHTELEAAKPDVVVVGTPWDGAMGSAPGTRYGPRAIRTAEYTGARGGDWTHPVTRINPLQHVSIVDYGDVPIVHGAPEESFRRVRAVVTEVAQIGAIPVMLGGDHSVTWPHVQGLTAVHGKGRVGVVHLDAHADTWPKAPFEYTSHGSGMRQLVEGGDVRPEHFVQVGLRSSTDAETLGFMESAGMRSHWMAEIRADGMPAVLDRAIAEALDGPDVLFLSVDIDVCDPAHAPGTGAPEPGGITSVDLLEAIRRVAHEARIAGMDVVEVSPPYDVGPAITAILAHRVVYEALTGTAMRRIGGLPSGYAHPRPLRGPRD